MHEPGAEVLVDVSLDDPTQILSVGASKPRLLITGALSRPDILASLDEARSRIDMRFVEYEREWGDGLDRELYRAYGLVTAWEEEWNAAALLRRVAPTAVVFMQGASLNQMALRVACRRRGVPAIHLEHGLPFPIDDRAAASRQTTTPGLATWRTHAFFARSILEAPSPLGRYAWDVRRRGATTDLLRRWAWLRRYDAYVSYSQACFEAHCDLDRLTPDAVARAEFVGIPQFDGFGHRSAAVDERAVVLVDNQNANAGLFGWTMEARKAFVCELHGVIRELGLRLYVKLHPGDRSDAWRAMHRAGEVQIIDRLDLEGLANRVGTVIGGFSTLQIPLACLANTAMIVLEIHPDGGSWYPSRAFVAAGVACPVRTLGELREALVGRADLRAHQRAHKAAFERSFMFALDGGAQSRLAAALERAVTPLSGG